MKNRLIIQKTDSDCGLACITMIAECPYEEVLSNFMKLGLYGKHNKTRPYATNFKDVKSILSSLGFEGKVKKFKTWDEINCPSIVKIPNGRKRSFHWIVAIPHSEHKVVIYDPCFEFLSYFENPPLDEAYIDPNNFMGKFKPNGSFIACQKIK
jgi:ABC-type bacteriocin/lantibiotic exporter with double-glycine peptidase domain